MTRDIIEEKLRRNHISAAADLPERLAAYLEILQDWNSRMDLTADSGDEELLDRHFIDSLTVLNTGLIPQGGRLIDVGTGAGFPGLVLAIARPDLQVTLLDAQQKRLRFLEAAAAAAGAKNVTFLHTRAEDAGRNPACRERFDIATGRAVAPLNVLCEYLLPFVRTSGYALCWKGPGVRDEMAGGRAAARVLGGRIEEPCAYAVDGRDWEHLIVPVKKMTSTPKAYPRKAGTPKNSPLGA